MIMAQAYSMGWRVAEPAAAWAGDNSRNPPPVGPANDPVFHGWAKRGPKRPLEADQAPHLDADVVEAYRRLGEGWHARINEVLRAHMPKGRH